MSTKDIIETVLSAAPAANPEFVESYVNALDETAHADIYGNRRLPNNRTVEDEALRMFAPATPAKEPVAESVEEQRKRYDGMTRADFEKLSAWQRHEVLEKVKGAPPSKKPRPAPVTRAEILKHSGLTNAVFESLPLERRMSLENETRFNRSEVR